MASAPPLATAPQAQFMEAFYANGKFGIPRGTAVVAGLVAALSIGSILSDSFRGTVALIPGQYARAVTPPCISLLCFYPQSCKYEFIFKR